MSGRGERVRVDTDGIHLAGSFEGSADVYFGDHRGWSFSVDAPGRDLVRWPRKMARFLEGWSDVRVVADGEELFSGRVAFTAADREVEMVDRNGIPVIIDKWGLVQRPFATRAEGLVGSLADESLRILDVVRETHGIEGWIAFGTLLGAARSGAAIGHDSDVDLCYLSEQATPAQMTVELWSIGRALREAGMRVVMKSGSFLTVQVPTPDGAGAGIDLYTTFFVDGLLYETATVRAPVPRSAILPLRPIEFEGRTMPGPADPAALLRVSYGPGWKVPDPSFRHEPGPEIEERFDGWFGHLWRQRRDWSTHNAQSAEQGRSASPFATWVAGRLDAGAGVIEVGPGDGADARHLAEAGFDVLALDYALPGPRLWPRHERLSRSNLNLYDERDVLTRGVLLVRRDGRQVVLARQLLEALAPEGVDGFWRLASTALRRGGDLYLESRAWSRPSLAERRAERGPRLRQVSPAEVARAARQFGGEVVHQDGVPEAEQVLACPTTAPPARWRMVVRWSGRASGNRTESSE